MLPLWGWNNQRRDERQYPGGRAWHITGGRADALARQGRSVLIEALVLGVACRALLCPWRQLSPFISIRTKAALQEAKARGVSEGGMRDKTMKRNAAVQEKALERAQKVAGIIQPLKEAGKSLREIAGELNRAGVNTARGGEWQTSQVKRTIERLDA